SLLGLVAGERVGDGLPYFRGFRASEADLMWLGAALASSGAWRMFPLAGVTPEAAGVRTRGLPTIRVTRADLRDAQRSYTNGKDPDVIALGSPQLSSDELRAIARLVDRKEPRIPVWVFTSAAARGGLPRRHVPRGAPPRAPVGHGRRSVGKGSVLPPEPVPPEGRPRRHRGAPGAIRMKVLARPIAPGRASAIATVSRAPFSVVGGAEPGAGRILDPRTDA